MDTEDGGTWDCATFYSFCKAQQGLEFLNLNSNFLQDSFICNNRRAIESLKNLRSLHLASNLITDYGLSKLSSFRSRVADLDLSENAIKSMPCRAFTSRLFHHVQELHVGNSRLTSQALVTFTERARVGGAFANIQRLSMNNCNFADANIDLIFQLVRKLARLVILGLEDNHFSDFSHKFLCEQLENVTNRGITFHMTENPIARTNKVPVPHFIITSRSRGEER
tara:strand:+ start:1049 stop:1720 length:672 start_codon:yes stop_codon:yes gene_type:complete